MNSKIYIIVLLVLFSFFCSKEKQDIVKKSDVNTVEKQEAVNQQDSEEDFKDDEIEYNDESTEVKDKGEPCKDHIYILKPGAIESLKFSIKTDYNEETENIDVSIDDSRVKDPDVSISADYAEVITRTVEYPIWVVDAEEFLRDESHNNITKLIFRRGNKEFWIEFSGEDNKGVIWAFSPPEIFGRKSKSEVAEFLDSDELVIEYKDYDNNGKLYSFQVERDYYEKNINIMIFDITVTTPVEGIKLFAYFEVKYGIDSKTKGTMSIFVEKYSKKNDFHIKGPGFDVNCEDDDME